ncbi:hypothetical protein TCDM_05318 [Trypanosoma cruzi Dm28c]|uniref:Uncharacterized protein n=1 Tax=Trypanosoma cruzi Dm28c TaxID=1416333 RepID=V5DFA3_TRYCR|nr:hypothetical protein TCDM_05318 [Trypanosoma cruzi Dm28c]
MCVKILLLCWRCISFIYFFLSFFLRSTFGRLRFFFYPLFFLFFVFVLFVFFSYVCGCVPSFLGFSFFFRAVPFMFFNLFFALAMIVS